MSILARPDEDNSNLTILSNVNVCLPEKKTDEDNSNLTILSNGFGSEILSGF